MVVNPSHLLRRVFVFRLAVNFRSYFDFRAMKEINIYDALILLRKLSKQNFPCKISFISCNRTQGTSSGLVVVEKCILTKGLPSKKSKYAKNLIAYTDMANKEPNKHFWLPLLMTINDLKISHDRIRK